MTPAEKLSALKKLGEVRRASKVPDGYFALGYFHNGYYECDFVSPWTKCAQNVDSKLMLVGQDWASEDYMSREPRPLVRDLGFDSAFDTNPNIDSLLKLFNMKFSDTFATNAFAYIKPGKSDSKIEPPILKQSVDRFLIPQLDIVQPKIAICLGLETVNAVRAVLNKQKFSDIPKAIAESFRYGKTTIFTSGHPGRLGVRSRTWEVMCEDWLRIGKFLG